ncbi:hypothetical protein N9954_08575, partial [Maribacter sp.]|nr:hypothetical protein [Maribacter sp.]
IHNYSSAENSYINNTIGAVEDSLGILYFCSRGGVNIFDGVNWETIFLPEKRLARSITIDEKNKVYVGAFGEMGYLEADYYGKMKYVSLMHKLDEKYRNITEVWETLATSKGIYFRTKENIFLWTGKKFKIWPPEGEQAYRCYVVNDTLYTRIKGKGLVYMNGDKLELVNGGEAFTDDGVMALTPNGGGGLVAGTYRKGFFSQQNKKIFYGPNELCEIRFC